MTAEEKRLRKEKKQRAKEMREKKKKEEKPPFRPWADTPDKGEVKEI